MLTKKLHSIVEIPVIKDNKFKYNEEVYNLQELTKTEVTDIWISEENSKDWVLSIQKNTIYHANIKPDFLQYALINELLCPDVKGEKGLCLSALKEELWAVPDNILPSYLLWRRDFFNNMYKYYTEDYEDKFYAQEMKSCYEYIDTLV